MDKESIIEFEERRFKEHEDMIDECDKHLVGVCKCPFCGHIQFYDKGMGNTCDNVKCEKEFKID